MKIYVEMWLSCLLKVLGRPWQDLDEETKWIVLTTWRYMP